MTSTLKERYSSLDGLRAYAVIGILMMHVLANIVLKPTPSFVTEKLIPYFTNGTYLFMMVSAFSLSCGYFVRIKNGDITPNEFYKKRYHRIWPFFAVMVMIDVALDHSPSQLYEAFSNLTLTFNYLPYPHMSVIGVGWFLGLIFMFYISYPFFVFLIDNKKRAWIVLILSIAMSWTAASYFSSSDFVVKPIDNIYMIFSAPFFILGGIIFHYRQRISNVSKKHGEWYGYVWLIVVITIILLRVGMSLTIPESIVLPELFIMSILLLYAISSNDIILNNPITRYLSGISLEIYLCHMMLYRVVEMLHLERFVPNGNILYPLTCVLVMGGGNYIFSYYQVCSISSDKMVTLSSY